MSTKIFKLDKEKVLEEINKSNDIGEALYRLYKTVLPDFEHATAVNGYPRVNLITALEIIKAFDKKFPHQIGTIGFAWLQKGFEHDEELKDWEVDVSGVSLHFENNTGYSI